MWRVCLERFDAGATGRHSAPPRGRADPADLTNLPWRAGRPATPAAHAAGARGDQRVGPARAPFFGAAARRMLALARGGVFGGARHA